MSFYVMVESPYQKFNMETYSGFESFGKVFAFMHGPLTPKFVKSPLCPKEGVGQDIDK